MIYISLILIINKNIIMKTMEKIELVALIVAMLSTVIFWIAGVKENDTLSLVALFTASVSAFVFLGAKGIKALKEPY